MLLQASPYLVTFLGHLVTELRAGSHLDAGGDGYLIGAWARALAAATAVVDVILDGLRAGLHLAKHQCGLGSRRAGQAALVADVLRAGLARSAGAVGHGARHQALLTVHRVAHVDGLADGGHTQIGDDGAGGVAQSHLAVATGVVGQTEYIRARSGARQQEVLDVLSVPVTVTIHNRFVFG